MGVDVDAERSVLGAMLLARDAIATTSEIVRPAEFNLPAHVHIYEAILSLYGVGKPVDHLTVAAELASRHVVEAAGHPGYLVELQTWCPAMSSVGSYARIVADAARRRDIVAAGRYLVALGESRPADVDEAIATAEDAVLAIRDRRPGERSQHDMRFVMDRVLANLDDDNAASTVSTGYVDLDAALDGGLPRRTMTVVAGRPGSGKSMLLTGIARHVASLGLPVAYVTLEMSAEEVGQRLVSAEAQVPLSAIRGRVLSVAQRDRVDAAADRLAGIPLELDATATMRLADVRARATRVQQKHGGLGLVVVDFLQTVVPSSGDNRNLEVGGLAYGLKRLAGDLDVPFLVASSLNRGPEHRADHRPILADLRDSGDIEGAADVVLSLYRDEVYNRETLAPGIAELNILKNRQGGLGTVRLASLLDLSAFRSLARAV